MNAARALRTFLVAGVLSWLPSSALPAQEHRVELDTVWRTPGRPYEAGLVQRALLGSGWRALWSTPLPVPVFDLDTFDGGLLLEGPGGGNQTRSLRFRSGSGRTWNFRSIDKDAARTLPPDLRESAAAWILQDQISSLLPLGALVAPPVLAAAGVLHAVPVLGVLPDDPELGAFRSEFAGVVGFMEERPDEGPDGTPGFAGSTRIVGSERLFELLEESPAYRVDAVALLRARLVDALLGDWDRHPGQWRWAAFPAGDVIRFVPIPRDRDWALARIDGFLPALGRFTWPQYMGIGPDLGSAFRRTWSGQALDRRLLVGLPREVWMDVAREVSGHITDDVLTAAVARLPAPHRALAGAELLAMLRRRRDQLPEFAAEYYRLLAGWADVHATDAEERVHVEADEGGAVRVEIRAAGHQDAVFQRTFHVSESREVRLYLHGGDDTLTVVGRPPAGLTLRVVGGGGRDVFGAGSDRVLLYDEEDSARAPGAVVNRRVWREPYDPAERTDQVPARDWGSQYFPDPRISYAPERGITVGMGFRRDGYGFRSWPYRNRTRAGLAVATETGRPEAYLSVDLPLLGDARMVLGGQLRGAEERYYHGLGNAVAAHGDDDRYQADRREVRLDAAVHHPLPGGGGVMVEAAMRRLSNLGNPGTLVEQERPYGYPDFTQVAIAGRITWKGPRHSTPLETSPAVEAALSWHPPLLDVEQSFAVLAAEARGSISLAGAARTPVVLAGRLGGRRVVGGMVPYHERAFLGGRQNLRGYRPQRFAGDASIFVNTEARVGLGRVFLLLPGDIGVFGLADAGRVDHEGASPGGWHTSAGGGVWLSFLNAYSLTAAVARGEETNLYVTLGFPF